MKQHDAPDPLPTLGPPIRQEPKPVPEWVADDSSKPHIQRNTKDGTMRNCPPEPAAVRCLTDTTHDEWAAIHARQAEDMRSINDWINRNGKR